KRRDHEQDEGRSEARPDAAVPRRIDHTARRALPVAVSVWRRTVPPPDRSHQRNANEKATDTRQATGFPSTHAGVTRTAPRARRAASSSPSERSTDLTTVMSLQTPPLSTTHRTRTVP